MTVAGQPTVSYGYDNADRLTSITQGGNVVGFAYDTAGRRSTLTLPNTISTEYAYDTASRLTGLTYKHGTDTLGSLTYTYDANTQRRRIGGPWARTGLPQAVASATYNAANHQLTFGSQTLTYDLNGNLTSDGANTYTWDARNQLAAISGASSASFAADALGRRRQKIINGNTTTFLYDGLNAVQETTGSGVANLLTGLGLDEGLMRAEAAGPSHLLTDALGSALALADASGALVTEYTYEPFGATTASGASSQNAAQFTARENDATGLYYYRARYYHPALQRFLSEDPIAFAGGDTNFYTYVRNAPLLYRDPEGLELVGVTGGLSFFGGWGPTRPGTVNVAATGSVFAGLSRSGGCVGHGGAVSWGAGSSNEWTQQGGSAYGVGVAKLGPGIFFSNADSFAELSGKFETTIIAAAIVNIQYDTATDPATGKTTRVLSLAPGIGAGYATLNTFTPRTKDVATYPCDAPSSALVGSPLVGRKSASPSLPR
jgi:RHS repeat-associated protein